MSGFGIVLNDTQLELLPSGALWWPDQACLCVSDLHLGKSERIARLGGTLLPPYDTSETLLRLRLEVDALNPKTVISLGDSFDDQNAEHGLQAAETRMLAAMMAGRRWIWIAGNHDPGPVETPGTWVNVHRSGPLTFRHIAEEGTAAGEISGHYHPKTSVTLRARRITRPCFLGDDYRLILPSFGAYTGGLSVEHPALNALFSSGATAYLTGKKVHPVPYNTGNTHSSRDACAASA